MSKWISFVDSQPISLDQRVFLWDSQDKRVTTGYYNSDITGYTVRKKDGGVSNIWDLEQDIYSDTNRYTHWRKIFKGPDDSPYVLHKDIDFSKVKVPILSEGGWKNLDGSKIVEEIKAMEELTHEG